MTRHDNAGKTTDQAGDAVAAWLEQRSLGVRKVNYKLRDWLFARQVRACTAHWCQTFRAAISLLCALRLSLSRAALLGRAVPYRVSGRNGRGGAIA